MRAQPGRGGGPARGRRANLQDDGRTEAPHAAGAHAVTDRRGADATRRDSRHRIGHESGEGSRRDDSASLLQPDRESLAQVGPRPRVAALAERLGAQRDVAEGTARRRARLDAAKAVLLASFLPTPLSVTFYVQRRPMNESA